jgi:hypothetical protein
MKYYLVKILRFFAANSLILTFMLIESIYEFVVNEKEISGPHRRRNFCRKRYQNLS